MHVSIHSKTVGSRSKGKTSWGFVWDLAKSAQVNRPHYSEGIGAHPWAVTAQGTSTHEYASGSRGGNRIEVDAKVTIQLTPQDICDLVNLALSNGLVKVVPSQDGQSNASAA